VHSHFTANYTRAFGALFLAGITVAAAAQTDEPAGARSMFYNPATGTLVAAPKPVTAGPSAVRFVGIHYWFDLDGVGPVTDRHVFHTGQRIRLNVRSNCDGYLAVWALGSDGKGTLLFPPAGGGSSIVLKREEPFVSSSIRFSAPAKDERLFLFFARQKSSLPSFDTLQGNAAIAAFNNAGARDLSMAVEDAAKSEFGTYVVNRAGGTVSREILLRHTDAPMK